ncbi:hypothetical protein Peur_039314 [Populus x canadensis]
MSRCWLVLQMSFRRVQGQHVHAPCTTITVLDMNLIFHRSSSFPLSLRKHTTVFSREGKIEAV